MKLLYGTGNPAKLAAMRKRLKELDIELMGLQDLDGELPSVPEDGHTPLENARQKATAYYHAFGIPVFSCDSGLYFDDVPDEIQPGVHVRTIDEKYLTDDEMVEYYTNLVRQYGDLTARYKNAICLVLDEAHVYEAMEPSMESEPFLLTGKPHARVNEGFPLDSLSKDLRTGEYYYDLPNGELEQLAVEDGFLEFFRQVLSGHGTIPFCAMDYEVQIRKTLPFYEEMYQQIISIVKSLNKTSIHWLDIGCGTGKMARTALECLEDRIQKMLLVDTDNDMLKQAKEFCQDERVGFLQSDVRELSCQSEYDVVTSVQVFHYLKGQERVRALRRCYDSLKQGGVYLTFDNFAPDTEEGKVLSLDRWKRFQMENGKSEEEATAHMERYDKAYFPITIQEQMQLLKNCGFRMVELFWVSYMQAGILAKK